MSSFEDFVRHVGRALRDHSLLTRDPLHNLALSLAISSLAFLVTVVVGRPYIVLLHKKKIGKQIRVDGPESHMVKLGTPTMGGVMFTVV
ncbi:MAG TPA: phospho-N-acetylmuramoyl-pentapeptide-transferase, partial [Nitrolancea sp.]|nr:phospho-N-acetylmuramoyl-pentapeptide-transferase [Nitrolancea sp.]